MTHADDGACPLRRRSASPASPWKAVKVKYTAKVTAAVGDLLRQRRRRPRARPRVASHTAPYGNHGLATLALLGLGLRDKISASYDRRALATTATGRPRRRALTHRGPRGAGHRGRRLHPAHDRPAVAGPPAQLDAAVGPQAEGSRATASTSRPTAASSPATTRASTRRAGRRRRRLRRGVVVAPARRHCGGGDARGGGDESWVFVRDVTEDVVPRARGQARRRGARALLREPLRARGRRGCALLTQPDKPHRRRPRPRRRARAPLRRPAFNEHPAARRALRVPRGEPPARRACRARSRRGERHVFVPWHRESVVDLARNTIPIRAGSTRRRAPSAGSSSATRTSTSRSARSASKRSSSP